MCVREMGDCIQFNVVVDLFKYFVDVSCVERKRGEKERESNKIYFRLKWY